VTVTTKNEASGNRRLLALVIIATGVGPLSMNLFVPSMPGMQQVFGVGYGTVQLTLTLYLFGLAGAQLVHGPLSDRFGRRPVMVWGLAVNLIGSAMCLLAPTIYLLIAGRFVQAVGGCVGMVVGRAIVRDCFDRTRTATMLSYVTMVMVVAPMLAPAIGGYLDVWFGWRASFLFVFGISFLVLAATVRWLPETLAERRTGTGFRDITGDFLRLLRYRTFCGYALQVSFTSVTFLSFVGSAPLVTVELLGGLPSDYGLHFIPIAGTYMIANFFSARLTPRLGIERMITIGTLIALCGGSTMLVTQLTGNLSMLTLFGPMVIMAAGHGFCIPNGLAGAISVEPRSAGSAAGLSGFLQIASGACASVIVGSLMADTALPIAIAMFLGAVGGISIHIWGVLLAPRAFSD
jgi:MFS transporter, DHA1 family, multidrug resistance protein